MFYECFEKIARKMTRVDKSVMKKLDEQLLSHLRDKASRAKTMAKRDRKKKVIQAGKDKAELKGSLKGGAIGAGIGGVGAGVAGYATGRSKERNTYQPYISDYSVY